MDKVTLAKKKHEVKTMEHNVSTYELRIFELECDIERVREQIKICEDRRVALLAELDESQGG